MSSPIVSVFLEESGNDLADIVLDILKIAACENREILNQLFTLLFARCADAVGHVAGTPPFNKQFYLCVISSALYSRSNFSRTTYLITSVCCEITIFQGRAPSRSIGPREGF